MVNKNIIEINGRRYDAISGRPLDPVIDDFKPQASDSKSNKQQSDKSQNIEVHHVKATGRAKAAAKHAHTPEHAKTLMRQAVSKPQAKQRRIRSVQLPASSSPIRRKTSSPVTQAEVNAERLKRAHDIQRNYLVRRFSSAAPSRTSTARPAMSLKQSAQPPARSKAIPATKATEASPAQILLEKGLSSATSHKQAPPKIKHHNARHKLHRKLQRLTWT